MDWKTTRYNHVLEAVITYTDELAYKQAKEADEMLAQGIYLGTFFIYSFHHNLKVRVADLELIRGIINTDSRM